MCPDPQLLSIYMDGEMPSPWKEKMETHLAECSECREKLENYRQLRGLFTKDADGIAKPLAEASASVWRRLEAAQYRQGRSARQNRRIYNRALWRRRVSIPLPLAAAAAILIIFAAGLWLRVDSNNNNFNYASQPAEPANFMLAAEEEIPVMPAADIESVLQYLGSGSGDIYIILPESRNFSRSGDPAIVRAADYLGR